MVIFQVFITMFKQAEQGVCKKKIQAILEPLLYENYKPTDTKRFVCYSKIFGNNWTSHSLLNNNSLLLQTD